jgi:TetR/AcrR family transcriptional regulator
MPQRRSDRREQILQALVAMLEQDPGGKITTARLAETVGVSEAALYRHFPSKTKMFESLIEFVEESLFSRINLILEEEKTALDRCRVMLRLLLAFCEHNPGITRILSGNALAGETERLHQRVAQVYERLETQLRQTLRQAEFEEGLRPVMLVNETSGTLLAMAEGRIAQFVRSKFQRSPTAGWDEQWSILTSELMREVPRAGS